jgi:hypothetical protein
MDANGDALVAWQRSDGLNQRVQVRTIGAGGLLGQLRTVSPAGQDAIDPRAAIDGNGRALVVWQRSDGTNHRIQIRSVTQAEVLGSIKTLSLAGQDAVAPVVAVDPTGDALALWTRADGPTPRVQGARIASTDAPASALTFSSTARPAIGPGAAIDPSGAGLAIWQTSDGTNQRVAALTGL